MKFRLCTAAVAVASLFPPCVALAQAEAPEGPFVGGVFARPLLPSPPPAISVPEVADVIAPPIYDSDGNANELFVAFRYDNSSGILDTPALAKANSHADFEQAVVDAVKGANAVTQGALGHPSHARMLTDGMRLHSDVRAKLTGDDPRERLEQYMVLQYPTVQAAIHARQTLAHHPSVASVGNNDRFELSFAPNDPYFAIQPNAPSAGRYQWGLHAMNFPAAWDVAPGFGYVAAADSGLVNDVAPFDLTGNYRTQFSFRAPGFAPGGEFHGTHVLGIIGATGNNGVGIAGGCPTCSVAMAAFSGSDSDLIYAIVRLAEEGFQAINLSLNAEGHPTVTCPDVGYQAVCDAISFSDRRDVLLIESAGNYKTSAPAFPANHPSVLAVAGAQNNVVATPQNWSMWNTNMWDGFAVVGSANAGGNGVIAPAKSIVSTVPPGAIYNWQPMYLCGDGSYSGSLVDESGVANDGYGSCTGTSMAAPHVSALAGILRSINPRLSKDTIKTYIRYSGSNASAPNFAVGYGMPNALTAVNTLVAVTPNRLTPLFAFYSDTRRDYFYTTIPQMAVAAAYGTLAPRRNVTPNNLHAVPSALYFSAGSRSITNYPSFPDQPWFGGPAGPYANPTADAWVFTTPSNPKNAAVPLVPLYRLSWKCGDPTSNPPTAICAAYPEHVDTTYTADSAGVAAFQSWGYKLDGIEGYIYPKTITQPTGTERLMRKYNPTRDDHAIFPESFMATMTAQGYTQNSGSDWLGYVYRNSSGNVPTIQ